MVRRNCVEWFTKVKAKVLFDLFLLFLEWISSSTLTIEWLRVRARFYVGVEMLQADKQQTQTYFNNNKKSEWNQAELISERFVDIFIIANKSFAFSLPQQNIVLEIGKRKVLYKLIALRRRIVHICLFAFNAHTHHIQRNSNSV